MSNPSLILPQSPAYGEDYVYAAQVEDGAVPLYNVLPLTFTRASGGTRINKDGLVQNMPYNLVAQSESIGTSPWLLNGATLTSGQTDPSGGTTAVKVELASGGNNYVYQGIPFTNPINIVSAYLRADSATTIGFSVGGSTPNAVNLTTTWQLFTFSSTDTSGGIIFDNYFGPSPTQQAKTFYVWHPQLNIGSTAQPYLATTDRLNMPRITYPVGGGCGALLLEKQSTNLVTYSEQLDNAGWSKSNATITANAVTSPDGTQNADKLIANTSSSSHLIQQTFTPLSATSYTLSTYAKAGEYNFIGLQIAFGGINAYASYNLSTGVVFLSGGGATATIQNAGNGWYRCFITATTISTSASIFNIRIENDGSLNNFVGNNVDGIYAWGAQLEASSYATSYIPTTSSSATRVADGPLNLSTTQTLTNFTLFWDGLIFENDNNMFFGSGSSAWYIDIDGSSNRIVLDLASGRIYQSTNAGITTNQRFKLAIKRSAGVVDAFVNGTKLTPTIQVTDTTSLTLSSITWGFSSTYYPKMKVNEICAFQVALNDADAIALTTI